MLRRTAPRSEGKMAPSAIGGTRLRFPEAGGQLRKQTNGVARRGPRSLRCGRRWPVSGLRGKVGCRSRYGIAALPACPAQRTLSASGEKMPCRPNSSHQGDPRRRREGGLRSRSPFPRLRLGGGSMSFLLSFCLRRLYSATVLPPGSR